MASLADILRQAVASAVAQAKSAVATAASSTVRRAALSSPQDRFVYDGEVLSAASSNVRNGRYDYRRGILTIQYKDGRTYDYYLVTQVEAGMYYNAGSKGGAVWDLLRIRGTQRGHKKPYIRTK